jgi:hypothetical protein
MSGSFIAGRFRFEVARSDRTFRGGDKLQELVDDTFDLRLTNTGRVPNLDGAPVASWLLARLGKLTDEGMACLFGEESNDGGGYAIAFFALDEREDLAAEFQLQGNSMGAAVFGDCVSTCSPEDVLQALAQALLANPEELVPCELSVIDLEWFEEPGAYTPRPDSDSRNKYGWDRSQFFGKSNIRERF